MKKRDALPYLIPLFLLGCKPPESNKSKSTPSPKSLVASISSVESTLDMEFKEKALPQLHPAYRDEHFKEVKTTVLDKLSVGDNLLYLNRESRPGYFDGKQHPALYVFLKGTPEARSCFTYSESLTCSTMEGDLEAMVASYPKDGDVISFLKSNTETNSQIVTDQVSIIISDDSSHGKLELLNNQ